ncbi:bifunctional 23S rRNA (guanine(2069)-N(7))-methyltransferase RlmK/23S rRNA (guanine(2445)-N(2))-methyltransferase RlmL [Buchnera aphidicola]|uniref:Ribosomal RNA large subunit methyltransferase K/L n=1 Tax=Buchnera aphidicola str. Ua (Uroleucon ambrosiae) TaxID=1005057 RepID=G2LPL5_BUCUM|nr:bifunctional 23S rRNA (guanine(2069)-N(7))-methyltransferase RlmK/23S rRNA (guanine(2445)-N(2))-methyltransferase RlmL [Buchnera aphidicola]AEO08152.1 23S rRNA m(2)G2445 methyltransferase [Buchnera aphidicola str. Ua (Uroleucon ambrosiae)]
MKINYLFASTHFGTEQLLKQELLRLGIKNSTIINGGVYYEANDFLLYKTLMWSRIASRIFLCITNFYIKNSQDLYLKIYDIDWNKIFYKNSTFAINFKGTNNIIRNSLFGALITKDAIIDQFRKKYCIRLNINLIEPDIRIKLLLLNNNIIHVMLDLSGESLHKRGYRKFFNQTPIKENLASAIIINSGWNKNLPIIDPMCGSGTLLIEAAMMASNRAPGLKRSKWGFQSWKDYNKKIWTQIIQEAKEKFEIGMQTCLKNFFIGYDSNTDIIKKAKINALHAGVLKIIEFKTQNLENFKNINQTKIESGILLTNPPYGNRYKTESQLVSLYIQLGIISKNYFENWKLSIFSASKFLFNFLQMKPNKKYFFKNGSLDCIQHNYTIYLKNKVIINNEYENRLKKNFKKFKKWADIQNIECFRIYNADLPNYNIIVDVYKNWIVIQEYQAPKEIHSYKTLRRLCDAIYYTKKILSVSIDNIIFKIRKKNTHKTQYKKLSNSNNFILIQEYHAKFLVNLIDYIDTGLFSDKRILRKLLGKMSYDKDFLNLFSYTATASVYAGLGNAKSTTSIDISNTYIKWSMKNMAINNLTGSQHIFIKSDCLKWIKKTHKTFDLIFINPPTFSNSKNMNQSFDVKKDYFNLMINLKKILRYHGYIIFSSSTKNFELDYNFMNKIKLYAKKITQQVQSKDYLKYSNNYHSWLIQHIQ